MNDLEQLKALGFSQYEINCYLTLVTHHPANGSQLSKLSGIARSRIYDVLRNMTRKGLAMETESGLYVPLPPEELLKRLQAQFNGNIELLKKQLEAVSAETSYEYIWTIRGYAAVIQKAKEMIASASNELYVRLFPQAGSMLQRDLKTAARRGVGVRYIAMGEVPLAFDIQVIHPESHRLVEAIGGRSFDIIADRAEALVGIFESGKEEQTPINWTRNRWFIQANRDSLRHDFYHFFLNKVLDQGQMLSQHEQYIYDFIKADD
jgi:sugar-specific transcriptional regulator TrmB